MKIVIKNTKKQKMHTLLMQMLMVPLGIKITKLK